MRIEITNLTKLSFNKYNHLHWTKKKTFKDDLRSLVLSSFSKKLKDGYNLDFEFYFQGRRLDRVNVFHYAKIIEDTIFKQDQSNGWIKVNTFKSKENKCILILTPVSK